MITFFLYIEYTSIFKFRTLVKLDQQIKTIFVCILLIRLDWYLHQHVSFYMWSGVIFSLNPRWLDQMSNKWKAIGKIINFKCFSGIIWYLFLQTLNYSKKILSLLLNCIQRTVFAWGLPFSTITGNRNPFFSRYWWCVVDGVWTALVFGLYG